MRIVLIFLVLLMSFPAFPEELKFNNKEEALNYYMNKNNTPENIFQIQERDMKIMDVDGMNGLDIFIIDPNLCGNFKGCGGGVFLCQGKLSDCSDSHFCEANKSVIYEPTIKSKGHLLKCKNRT